MTRLETPIKDILGTKYYTYQLMATNYNPALNGTITIVCAVSNDYNAEQPSSVILYQNDVEIGSGTLQTTGTYKDHYTWTITCDTPGLQIFRVKDTSVEVYVENELVDMIYPVGSIYMSVNSTSPSVLFGGTWQQLEDTFLLACGSTYASDGANVHTAQHGEASHTLTASESGQKNLGTITSTGGSHSHKLSSTDTKARFLGTTSDGDGVTRNSIKPGTSTAVSNFLKSANSVDRYTNTNASGSLSVSTTISGSSATSSHNNMPPYMAVYMWKRTA